MKKVAIYARVSTEAQEEQKTIESQLTELREICKDFQVVKEYVDNGYSGEILTRPALDELRNDVKSGNCPFEALYIYDVDRLSRNHSHQGIIVEELKKRGIEIDIKDKPIEFTGEGKLLFNLLGAIAEYEKEKILERTRRGRIYKAKQKGFVGYIPPYGYNYAKKSSKRDGYFSVNKEEARVVNLIFDLYLRFQSINRVRKELTSRGIKPRKGGDKWCRSTIGDSLREEAYTGQGYYGKRESVETGNGKKYARRAKTGTRLREKDKWIPVKFPPIVDKDKFRLAQEILSKRYKPFGKSKYFYLLSGLIRCQNCGLPFTGAGRNGKYLYYRCTNRQRRAPFPKDCNARHIRADDLDNAVWQATSKAISNPKILMAHLLYLTEKMEDESILKKEKEELIQERNEVRRKKQRLDELYFRGLKSIEEYQEQLNRFNDQENKLSERIDEVEFKLDRKINKSLIIENARYFCNLARRRLQNLAHREKQWFLRFLIHEIELDSNRRRAKIIGEIPAKKEELQALFQSNLQKSGAVSMASRSRVQCSNSPFRFELEVKIQKLKR